MEQAMEIDGSLIDRGVVQVAAMMELAARTAPKSKGQDFIEILTLSGSRLKELAGAMIEFGREKNKENFDRDAANVAASGAVVLIGLRKSGSLGLDCGACGYVNCQAFDLAEKVDIDFSGPFCAYRLMDLGIAMGSAVKTAQMMNVDNRIMYRIGVAARWKGLVDWEIVLGIPLSATGKNIFFDRAEQKQKENERVK
jgi:uncharacterized ferredoxin-like protein